MYTHPSPYTTLDTRLVLHTKKGYIQKCMYISHVLITTFDIKVTSIPNSCYR